MIVLFNFNSYLGGGETLFVRIANYMEQRGEDYFLFFHKGSYIERDLTRIGIPEEKCHAVESDIDYYYLTKDKRTSLINELEKSIPGEGVCHLVSFCSRDLYTICVLNNRNERFRLGHLILHDQDNLYVCQTLFDKFISKYFNRRRFSSKKNISLNAKLFTELSEKYSVIPQSDLQTTLWREKFSIPIEYEKVIPLPTWDFSSSEDPIFLDKSREKKVIWIGRVVDFKIPALFAIIDYVGKHKDYSLTIIGSGDEKRIQDFIKQNQIDTHRMTFVGEVPYNQLGDVIRQHSIGYAMGTSIVEIGKYGIPVIMALGSPTFQLFKNDICGGVYIDVDKGNVGDNLYLNNDESIQVPIEESLLYIENNYVEAAQRCYEFVKSSFDLNTNIEAYIKIIKRSVNHHQINTSIPQSSWVRRSLYVFFK